MKKRFSRLLSGAILLCMIFSMVAPLTLFAVDSTTEDTSRYVLRETFTGSVNTKSTEAALTASKGYYVSVPSGSSYSVENHELEWTRASSSDNFIRIHPSYFGNTELLSQDFILSFWLKTNVENAGKNTVRVRVDGNSSDALWLSLNGKIVKDEWSLVEVVFYNSQAADNNGTAPYKVLINGVQKASGNLANATAINRITLMQGMEAGDYCIDDLTIATGTDSLINIPRTKLPERSVYYKEDFSSSSINTSSKDSALAAAKGFWASVSADSTYTVENDSLEWNRTAAYGDFIDIRFANFDTQDFLTKDFILSFWIKPDVEGDYKNAIQLKHSGSTDYITLSASWIEKDKWSLVEMAFHGSKTTDNGDGTTTTPYTMMINGVSKGNGGNVKNIANMSYFRLFHGTKAGNYSIDDIIIADGASSLINSLSPAPTVGNKILFHEDFEDAVNSDESKCESSNGFLATLKDGSEYVVENGVIKYIEKSSQDFVDLRFYYESTKLNLARDFILSFKLKPETTAFSTYFQWSENDSGVTESTLKLDCGRFKMNDVDYIDATLKSYEYNLIEIAFHFDKNATAVTGEQGAITSYTVMLNGKAVGTAETKYAFHNIDHFTLLRPGFYEFEMDDLIIAKGNDSLNNGNFSGYETPKYYFDKEPVTDYDYSFCVVGDTQKLVTFTNYNNIPYVYDWIEANAESKKMKFVFGLGDITDRDSDMEWQRASDAISKLNGLVPYSLTRGNHDGSENINKWFYVDEYTSQFAGFFGEGSMENSWRLLDAGNDKYLLITLDYEPTDDELAWAGEIIASYPDRKVIVTTHSYTTADGKFSSIGQNIWDNLLSKHANVFLVLAGHTSSDYVVTTQMTGKYGNVVTAMLIDPQSVDTTRGLGASGMVTMLYFKDGEPTIQVETYSTVKNKYFLEENQFNLDIDTWVPAKDLTLVGALLNITNDINVSYVANVPTGYTNPYMLFEFNGNSYTVKNYTTRADGKLVFKFVGVVPQMLGENIKATLYATNGDGVEESFEMAEYSVKQYCVNMLAKTTDAKLVTLLSDLLVYGAKAQIYMNYKTDALVTEGLTLIPSTFTAPTKSDKTLVGEADASVSWKGVALRYENAMAIKLSFVASADYTLKISINGRTVEYKVSDLAKEGDNYVVYFRGIEATEYANVVTATFYNAEGTQVGQSAQYSVNSYVFSKYTGNDTLADLVKATYNYGVSAENYVK